MGRRYGALPPLKEPSEADVTAVRAAYSATTGVTFPQATRGRGDAMCELPIPVDFLRTAPAYEPPYAGAEFQQPRSVPQPVCLPENPQMRTLLSMLGLTSEPVAKTFPRFVPSQVGRAPPAPPAATTAAPPSHDPAEIDLD
jgi:hypothetical protein